MFIQFRLYTINFQTVKRNKNTNGKVEEKNPRTTTKKVGKKLKILLAGNVFRKVGKEYTRSSTSKEIYKCSRQPIFHFSLSSPPLYLIDPQKLYNPYPKKGCNIAKNTLWYTIIEEEDEKRIKDLGFREK